jgi:hypothetical protein
MSEKESESKRFPRRQREDTSALTRGLASTTGEEDATPPPQKQQQVIFFPFPRGDGFGSVRRGFTQQGQKPRCATTRREDTAAGERRKAQEGAALPHKFCGPVRGCPVRARRHDSTAVIGPVIHQDSCLVGSVWLVHSVAMQTFCSLFFPTYVV